MGLDRILDWMMSERNAVEPRDVAIRRWQDVRHGDDLIAQLDAIFFEASNTKSFPSEEARTAFRERWFGRYLRDHPRWAYIAQAADGTVAGYLVGALDEPSSFEDFASAAQAFPAHLHVNLAPAFRSRGVGAELIEAFAADARRAGAKGIHVVTSADARNVRFYERVGFRPRATTTVNGNELVFLGRAL
jgi:GNAT superfamily N-acetyltransferase